ncbi:hypothetical protein D3C76_1292240 [compost metagenome]
MLNPENTSQRKLDMKFIFILTAVLAGCGGKPSLYQYDSSRQFKCDMDPYMQFCANHTVIRQHIENTEANSRKDESPANATLKPPIKNTEMEEPCTMPKNMSNRWQ